MKARYIQRGDSIDYTPAADVAAGDVVKIGHLTGIAKLDIKSGELGALALTGVYEFKVRAGESIQAGDVLFFDPEAGTVTREWTETGFGIGYAVCASNATEQTVLVRLEQGNVSVPTT